MSFPAKPLVAKHTGGVILLNTHKLITAEITFTHLHFHIFKDTNKSQV